MKFCWTFVTLIVCGAPFLPLTATGQAARDVTAYIEEVGDPLSQFYPDKSRKDQKSELEIFQGRLFIGHGDSRFDDSSVIIYYDPSSDAFGAVEDGRGDAVRLSESLTIPLRVSQNVLFVGGDDPIGQTNVHWLDGSLNVVKREDVAPAAHNRDVIAHDGRVFVFHGRDGEDIGYPKLLVSQGGTFVSVNTVPPPPGDIQSMSFGRFFTFGGDLYLASNPPFYLSRYVPLSGGGVGGFTWTLEQATRSDLFGASAAGTLPILETAEVGGRLLLRSEELYSAASLGRAPDVEQVVLPPGEIVVRLLERPGRAFVMTRSCGAGSCGTASDPWVHHVHATSDGRTLETLFSFESDHALLELEEMDGDFYFLAKDDLTLKRLSSSAWSSLPVADVQLAVTVSGDEADVRWSATASGSVERVVLEHRYNTTDFIEAEIWDGIELEAATTRTLSEQLLVGGLAPGRHAFRLRLHHDHGAVTVSEEQHVRIALGAPLFVSAAYPNPSQDTVFFDLATVAAQTVRYAVIDLAGRAVAVFDPLDLPPDTVRRLRVPTAGLASGTYFLRVGGSSGELTQPFTVQR